MLAEDCLRVGERLARGDGLVEFWVIDAELARFAVVNKEGLDSTISRLCAPLDPVET